MLFGGRGVVSLCIVVAFLWGGGGGGGQFVRFLCDTRCVLNFLNMC